MPFSCFEFFIALMAQYANHTGIIGAFEFKDGRSVRRVTRFEAEMLAANGFHCVALDDDGNQQFRVVVGKIPMDLEQVKALKLRSLKTQADKEQPDEPPPNAPSASPEPQPAASEPVVSYTREELEAIADSTGLKGLRKVGDGLGIKGKSIPELIKRILNKQG